MTKLLIAYGTTEGHTRKIAEFIADIARRDGCEVALMDTTAAAAGARQDYDAVILAASVHEGKHQSAMTHFVKDNVSWLNRVPSVFLSVSLGIAAEDPESKAEAEDNLRRFLADAAWQPERTRCVAGALVYTRYNFLKRIVMRLIAQRAGGDTDTSRDYEYTDWEDLRQFIGAFLADRVLRQATGERCSLPK
jgi:menaquinone-dependent protoporphyrinogen oxidase